MILSEKFNKKFFAIYGLGVTGKSVIKFLKRSGISNYVSWDDIKKKNKSNIKKFSNFLKIADYIIISPGINIKKSPLSKRLEKYRKKIITDLDLFYMTEKVPKTIVVTGTNGKSTTCKILEHFLKKNKHKVSLGGNIGHPVLEIKRSNRSFCIIEASSFHLAHSKFIKPNYATILNISKDHLDWHGSFDNYVNSKFKIFKFQDKNCFAFINTKNLIKIFKKKQYIGKLIKYNLNSFFKIKQEIKNKYLQLSINDQNLGFVYELSKVLKINKKNFIKSLKSFKGLPHRHEIFLESKNFKFINDSKATSFEASKSALKNNRNIFWILGGLPKKGDKFQLNKIKKNILGSFIIGKSPFFFKKQLSSNKLPFKISKNLSSAIRLVFNELSKSPKEKITILFSPASASFDQYKNFMDRGNQFKKLINIYARKYI